jgi:hypothetical protein
VTYSPNSSASLPGVTTTSVTAWGLPPSMNTPAERPDGPMPLDDARPLWNSINHKTVPDATLNLHQRAAFSTI